MKIRKLIFLFALLLMLPLAFASCSKDDDTSGTPQQEKGLPMRVTIVFEPGQLGAMITNDYLQLDVREFGNDHKDSVATSFVCMRTFELTAMAVKEWAADDLQKSPGTEHRLLILTSPELLRCLEGVVLRETDHVLLLKTHLADAKAIGPDGRTHVLNVSYSDAVRQVVQRRKEYFEEAFADSVKEKNIVQKEFGPYMIVREFTTILVADSLNETLQEMFPEKKIGYANQGNLYTLGEFDIENWCLADVDEKEDMSNLSEQAFVLAYTTWMNPITQDNVFCQPMQFIDLGVFNRSFEWYWITSRYDYDIWPQSVIIGEPGNTEEKLDYIIPKYHLKSWLERWLTTPDDMPEEEWGPKAKLSVWESRIVKQ